MELEDYEPSVAASIAVALGGSSSEGVPADRPDLHGDLPGLPAALGRGVAAIHAADVPEGALPFDPLAVIERRLTANLIVPSDLPEPYDRYTAEQLVEIFAEAELPGHYSPSPVSLCGALTVNRLLLGDGDVVAIDGPHGLVGDRHLDLAVIQHSIHHLLGAEAVFGFYEAYGSDPNIVALDHYVLAGLLLGWIT